MGNSGDAVRGGIAGIDGRGGGDKGVDSRGEEYVSIVVSMESVVIGGSEYDLLGGMVREGGRGD
jgi:hypothetical protein